eukprot:11213102-Lingulodinium_polyedra.AAC.1
MAQFSWRGSPNIASGLKRAAIIQDMSALCVKRLDGSRILRRPNAPPSYMITATMLPTPRWGNGKQEKVWLQRFEDSASKR